MNGLFLQGGGAKGAFQGGVIYGLYEKGIKFDIVTGTSIGAINSYFIYTKNIEMLKEFWTNIDMIKNEDEKISGDVIENKNLIDELYKLEGRDENIKAIYVNYVSVNNSNLKQVVVDLSRVDKEEAIDAIRYSSLLPLGIDEEISIDDIKENLDAQYLFDKFKDDLQKGRYDGYNLDGGILNNNFLSPFIKNKVDKLYMVSLKNNYEIPDYILNSYNESDLVLFEPITKLTSKDTLRFEREFCRDLFNEGYEMTKSI